MSVEMDVKFNITHIIITKILLVFSSKCRRLMYCFDDFSHGVDRPHRPEAEVELEAGTFDCHELESDVASQQGCYSPVSSVSDMEPAADHDGRPMWYSECQLVYQI